MNKKNFSAAFLMVFLTVMAMAAFEGPDTSATVNNIAATKKAADDTKVELTGMIVRRIGHEKYLFKDETGEVTVEIDDDDWGGLTVKPGMKVKLGGEIDREDDGTLEIEIDRVEAVPAVGKKSPKTESGKK